MALYAGGRLNNSFEVQADVKDAAGAGLSNALGLGGITNLDVVRIPGEGSPLSTAPISRGACFTPYSARARIENDRSAFSLFDELSRRRLEIRFMHSKLFPLQPACLLSIAQSSLVRSD